MDWRDHVDASHPSVIAMDAWLKSLHPFERRIQEAEIEELLEAAAAGRLWDSGDAKTKIKPIRDKPEVYELRRKALTKMLRFYHAEPTELPRSLVALHRHIKIDAPSQQREIDHAASMYVAARRAGWS